MFTVDLSIKRLFFDRAHIRDRVDRAKLATLRRAGGSVRLRARRSLRRRGGPSAAGSPPSVHTRDNYATLRNILFGLEGDDAVLIGPVGLNNSTRDTVPQLQEFGGTILATDQLEGDVWVPLSLTRYRPHLPKRRRLAALPERPFMFPALGAVAADAPELFARSLRE